MISPSAFGSTKELAVPSCKSLFSFYLPSGVYWLDVDGGSKDNSFKAYCEMETDGGNWTLVWSYTFTNYSNFKGGSNAITPRPNWPVSYSSRVDVAISTNPPLSETDFNAFEFSKWKTFGEEILVKSNINNWIICSPGKGNLANWSHGSVNCKIIKSITQHCPDGAPPTVFSRYFGAYCGPGFFADSLYYYFDGCTRYNWPTHDPCGKNSDRGLKNMQNPYGNIYIR